MAAAAVVACRHSFLKGVAPDEPQVLLKSRKFGLADGKGKRLYLISPHKLPFTAILTTVWQLNSERFPDVEPVKCQLNRRSSLSAGPTKALTTNPVESLTGTR